MRRPRNARSKPARFAKVAVAGALIPLSLTLGACAGGGSGSSSGGKTTLRITWWGNPERAKATQDAIALFEKAHPDVKVEAQPSAYPGYYDKLNTQITAGDAPDVFQVDTVTKYASKGSLADLGQYKDVLDTSAIDPAFLAQGSYQDKLYEVPAGSNPFALLYNAAAVQKAGATAPTSGMTWQQYADLAKAISAKGGGKTWGAADDSANVQAFEIFVRQRGGNLYSADGKKLGFTAADLTAWWQYWADLRKSGAVPPATVTEPGVTGDVTKVPIAKGLVAMDAYGTSTTLPGEDWKYVGLPGETAAKPGAYLKRSVNWGVYGHSKHAKEAAELVSFLVNDSAAGQKLGITRGAPANSKVLAALTPALSGTAQQVAQYTAYVGKPGNNSAAPPPSPAASTQIETDLFVRMAENVWFGKADVAKAAADFVKQAEQQLTDGF